jgi:hypothetical protein
MPTNYIRRFTQGLLINISFIIAGYFVIHPDPKGIGFSLFLMAYGIITSIFGVYFAMIQVVKTSDVYWLLISANLLNVYLLFKTTMPLITKEVNFSVWSLLLIFFMMGALSIYFLIKKLR